MEADDERLGRQEHFGRGNGRREGDAEEKDVIQESRKANQLFFGELLGPGAVLLLWRSLSVLWPCLLFVPSRVLGGVSDSQFD